MKLRHKILAFLMLPFKLVISTVLQWYMKRKMRKTLENMPDEMINE